MRAQLLLDENTHIHVLSSSPLAYIMCLFQLNSEYVYIIVHPCMHRICVCMSMLFECVLFVSQFTPVHHILYSDQSN